MEGYGCLAASNGAEALEQAESQHPDIVVMDVMMPVMGGCETLTKLLAHSNIPATMLSARDGNDERIKGPKLGADDHVAKPFHPDELIECIRTVLRRVGAQPEAEVSHVEKQLKSLVRTDGDAKAVVKWVRENFPGV